MMKAFQMDDLKIRVDVCKGEITMQKLYNFISKNSIPKNAYNYILVDFREAILNFAIEEIVEFKKWRKSNGIEGVSEFIFLSVSPKNTALLLMHDDGKTFSTLIGALQYMSLEKEYSRITEIIKSDEEFL